MGTIIITDLRSEQDLSFHFPALSRSEYISTQCSPVHTPLGSSLFQLVNVISVSSDQRKVWPSRERSALRPIQKVQPKKTGVGQRLQEKWKIEPSSANRAASAVRNACCRGLWIEAKLPLCILT